MQSESLHWRSLLDAGREQEGAGNLDEAERLFRAAIDQGGRDDIECWMRLGWTLYDKSDYAGAEDACRRAIRCDEENWCAHRALGRTLTRLERWNEAEQRLRRSLELKEKSLTWVFLGDAYTLQGREHEARRAYQQALVIDPADETAYYSLGVLYSDGGDWDSAARYLRKALELDETYVGAHRELASVLSCVDGQLDAAEHHARRALELAENDEMNQGILGNILVLQGRSKDAERHYARAVHLAPDNGYAHRMLAKCFSDNGKPELARASFEKAIELEPNSHRSYVQFADFLQEQGKDAEALRIIEAGLESLPDSEDLIRAKRKLSESGDQ